MQGKKMERYIRANCTYVLLTWQKGYLGKGFSLPLKRVTKYGQLLSIEGRVLFMKAMIQSEPKAMSVPLQWNLQAYYEL